MRGLLATLAAGFGRLLLHRDLFAAMMQANQGFLLRSSLADTSPTEEDLRVNNGRVRIWRRGHDGEDGASGEVVNDVNRHCGEKSA